MNITVSYEIGKSQIENFEGLVSEVFYSVLEIGRSLVREALEQADKVLMESRDRERYRCKGFQKTCIKTKLGAVEYKRRVYVDNAAAEKQHCVHLLDEALDIKKVGLVSSDVCQLAAEAVCGSTYTRCLMREIANIYLTHTNECIFSKCSFVNDVRP